MCDGSGATSWAHDQIGRVLTERRTIGAAVGLYVYYTFNKDGSLATLQTPPQKTITYTVGGAGRATSATDSGNSINFVTSATYAPPGELQTLLYGTAIHGALAYNSRLQPVQMFYGTNTPPAITSLTTTCPSTVGNVMNKTYNFSLGSGDNGNVMSITNCLNTTRSQSFTYDTLNRIASAESSGTQWGETYIIDSWGNLTNRAGISGKTYGEALNAGPATYANQLTGFGYDAAGNLTTNASTLYIYDAENRLVWTSQYRYIYDGDGNRVEKCAAASATTACPTSGTTGTLYWRGTGSDTLDETDLAGNALEDYVYFNGQRIARRDVSNDAVHFYFSDQVGSHAVVENATGTACEQDIDYYPYGGVEEDYCTTPVAQHYKFTGKERDAESGLDDFVARYDSSNLGRFMTPDWEAKPTAVPYAHFGNPQSLNLYSYVQNNPTTLGDPDGHECPDGSTGDCQGNKQQQWAAQHEASAQAAVAAHHTTSVGNISVIGTHVNDDGSVTTTTQRTVATFSTERGHEGEFLGATTQVDVTRTRETGGEPETALLGTTGPMSISQKDAVGLIGSRAFADAQEGAGQRSLAGEFFRAIGRHPAETLERGGAGVALGACLMAPGCKEGTLGVIGAIGGTAGASGAAAHEIYKWLKEENPD
jgi:RHS repeat-associated protein